MPLSIDTAETLHTSVGTVHPVVHRPVETIWQTLHVGNIRVAKCVVNQLARLPVTITILITDEPDMGGFTNKYPVIQRSEERRVGRECRYGRVREHVK